jgi:hypothetical protein
MNKAKLSSSFEESFLYYAIRVKMVSVANNTGKRSDEL